ncbi:hypothetical protein BCR42DRAFT_437524 [Absidia repens]|uniref:Translation elongation factor EF1B beta/delta subunit guanine nucleotide exchange domain-containing protein n=1 Tax=Absidia repens TaxID=90262 RepID=A0A1X2IGK4_9FUNG|nr:hypothetical protein BCR42DRAFT_437524 [Absidia repens]
MYFTLESGLAYKILNGFFENVSYVKGYISEKRRKTAAAEEVDIDLFGSGDEDVDEKAEKIKAPRVAEYNAKKSNKPKPLAKTTVTLDVKSWDDETDMEELTKGVRAIVMLVAIGVGIMKLQINCVVEDDKVSMDDLTEQIEALKDYVQSVDVAAMQKI